MHRRRTLLWVLTFLILAPFQAWAGGAIKTDILGFPLHWESTLTFNPDKGSLKDGVYSHDQSVQIIQDAFNTWIGILGPGGGLSVLEGVGLPESGSDIDATNYDALLNGGTPDCYDTDGGTPCFSPIVFDEDGEILDDLFGSCAKFSILGFAGFDDIEDGTGDPIKTIVKRGQALFSGACLPDAGGNTENKPGCGTCKRALTEEEIKTIITHEVGHLMGMDHSQVNPESFALCGGVEGCPAEVAQHIPTMFPILVNNADMLDLHRDDVAYFQRLYGDTSGNCAVKGTIFASDGSTEVRGVEVVARNTQPGMEDTDAISFVSGAESPKVNSFGRGQGNCKDRCGEYLITGLNSGASYQLCVQKILGQFTGGSSIEPVDPPFQLFTNACPEGLIVACNCTGGACDNFTGKNITTDANPASIAEQEVPSQILEGPSVDDASGGCTLAKPRIGVWSSIKNSLSP